MTTHPIERPDANQLLLTGGKAPESADFGQVPPSQVAGILLSGPTSYHCREFDKNNPGQGPLRYWPDGNPVYGVYLDLDIPALGLRRLYVEKLRMLTAIQEAMLRAGVKKVEAGGYLAVTWTGTEVGAGALPANTYQAEYRPGTPTGNGVLANGGQNGGSAPTYGTAPAQWQQGVPGAVNAQPAPPQYTAPPAYAPPAAPQMPVAPPVAPPPAPSAPPVAPAPQQPAQQHVLTETIAAAMRNAGIPTDGYVIVPG